MRRAPSPIRSLRLLHVLLLSVLLLGAPGCGDNVDLDPGKELTAFGFRQADNPGLAADAPATISGFALAVAVPVGTDVTALVATFTTTGETVTVRGMSQDSGATANNFTNPVVYTVVAGDGTQQSYTVIVTVASSAANELTGFAFLAADNPALTADVIATITGTDIAATVPFATDVTALVATFTTTGASVAIGGTAQVSGATPADFTAPVIYTVTAADATTADYTVTVAFAPSPEKALTGLSFAMAANPLLPIDVTGTTTGTEVAVEVPFGTDVTGLIATFTTTGAAVAVAGVPQTSGVTANDFTTPVTYTVTAADTTTADHVVTVTISPAAICDVLTDPVGGTVAVTNGGVFPSTASYGCTTGRLITPTGGETATCRFDGTWDPAVPPTCELTVLVVRLGDGVATLTNASTPVFLDERRVTDGALGRTLALPIATAGTGHPLTLSGTGQTEGHLSASADGRFVTLAGYAVAPGLASVAGSSTASVLRVAARVDAAGLVDTSTLLDIFSGQAVRAATTVDGAGFWAVGGSAGVRYALLGSTGTTTSVFNTITNLRAVETFGGQLYLSTDSVAPGVHSVGTGLPTTSGQTAAPIAATVDEPNGFAMVDVSPVITGPDTLYVAMAAAPGADRINLQKWTFDGVSWTQAAAFAPALAGTNAGTRGITAFVDGTGVRVVATTTLTPNLLVTLHDDGSTPTPTATVLATAATDTALRGVARSPSVP